MLSREIAAYGLYFFLQKIIIAFTAGFYGCSFEKGKPVERQGRKVSGLRDKTYDSGAANNEACFWPLLYLFIKESAMPDAKPVFEAHSAHRSIKSCLSGGLLFDSPFFQAPPITRQLRGLHATGSELKSLMPHRDVLIPGLLNMLEFLRFGAGFQPATMAGFHENNIPR